MSEVLVHVVEQLVVVSVDTNTGKAVACVGEDTQVQVLVDSAAKGVCVELENEILVTVEGLGARGRPGLNGAGAARYVKALTGKEVVIPYAEHNLTDVTFWSAIRDSTGDEVSPLLNFADDGTVTVRSLVPMDGITLTLE